jgi:Fur family transcriptional regulator, zinc uptake regulator
MSSNCRAATCGLSCASRSDAGAFDERNGSAAAREAGPGAIPDPALPGREQVMPREPDSGLARRRNRLLAPLGRVPREVFELLLSAEQPLKPYELLWRLQNARGRPAPPSTIYRALKTLVEAGLAHRIGIIGAYTACSEAQEAHEPAFLICDQCGLAREVDVSSVFAVLKAQIGSAGFAVNRVNFVLLGACASCRGASSDAAPRGDCPSSAEGARLDFAALRGPRS